jgi:Co/Zn/Cd efflux system component
MYLLASFVEVPMSGCCNHDHCSSGGQELNSPAWRRALWIALAVNALMFLAEIGAGLHAGSASLQADALDFLGDSANYALSLGVAGMALAWRARVALAKGATLLALGLWVIGVTAFYAWSGTLPKAPVMGVVGMLALLANGAVALMLFRFRAGDANMRSVWICSRNDVIGNLAVLLASAGVFGTGTGWPDLAVAAIMAGLGIASGWQIIRQAFSELAASGGPSGPHRGIFGSQSEIASGGEKQRAAPWPVGYR